MCADARPSRSGRAGWACPGDVHILSSVSARHVKWGLPLYDASTGLLPTSDTSAEVNIILTWTAFTQQTRKDRLSSRSWSHFFLHLEASLVFPRIGSHFFLSRQWTICGVMQRRSWFHCAACLRESHEFLRIPFLSPVLGPLSFTAFPPSVVTGDTQKKNNTGVSVCCHVVLVLFLFYSQTSLFGKLRGLVHSVVLATSLVSSRGHPIFTKNFQLLSCTNLLSFSLLLFLVPTFWC